LILVEGSIEVHIAAETAQPDIRDRNWKDPLLGLKRGSIWAEMLHLKARLGFHLGQLHLHARTTKRGTSSGILVYEEIESLSLSLLEDIAALYTETAHHMPHDLSCIHDMNRFYDTLAPMSKLLTRMDAFETNIQKLHSRHYSALVLARLTGRQVGDHWLHRDVVNMVRDTLKWFPDLKARFIYICLF